VTSKDFDEKYGPWIEAMRNGTPVIMSNSADEWIGPYTPQGIELGRRTTPEDHRHLHERADDLEWLSGVLKQVTGLTWGELTDEK